MRDQVNGLLSFLYVNYNKILNMSESNITGRHQNFRNTKMGHGPKLAGNHECRRKAAILFNP